MKPASLAWSAVWLVTNATFACAPSEPPPVTPPPATPPTVMIASPERAEPLPPPPPPPVAVAVEPRDSALDAVRDERRLTRKSRALLVTEIQGLESLFSAMAQGSPDRPRLMRRLAEGYVELRIAAARDRAQGGPDAARADKIVFASHAAAIRYYELVAHEYPQWCAAPNASDPANGVGCNDEVLYYLGLEAERAGQLDLARKSYLNLIQRWPQSRFIPSGYLAFGEMFMNEAERDPSRLPLAEESYQHVIKYPPPGNRVFGYAQYRLAQVMVKKGDDPRALSFLMKAAVHAKTHGDETGLAAAARRDVVGVYARVGDRAKAREFFARFASSAAELDEMLAALDRYPRAP